VDLVQEYFACKATVYDALFNSVGIASGNTAAFVPILMLFLLPLIYMYLSSSGNLPPKKEYDDEVCYESHCGLYNVVFFYSIHFISFVVIRTSKRLQRPLPLLCFGCAMEKCGTLSLLNRNK
jgi:hypothetical protein